MVNSDLSHPAHSFREVLEMPLEGPPDKEHARGVDRVGISLAQRLQLFAAHGVVGEGFVLDAGAVERRDH